MRLRWEQTVRQGDQYVEEVIEMEDEGQPSKNYDIPAFVDDKDVPIRLVFYEFVRLVQSLREVTSGEDECHEE